MTSNSVNYRDFSPLFSLYTNYYGAFNDNLDQWSSNQICHNSFRYNPKYPHRWTNAARNDTPERNRYFEYLLDKDRSPYRDLLKVMDYKIVRNSLTNFIDGVICYNTDNIDTAVFMCFFKSMRQIIECKSFSYFNYVLDNAKNEDEITEAWFLMHYFTENGNVTIPSTTVGDHTAIKTLWNEKYYDKKIDRKIICPIEDINSMKKSLNNYTYLQLSVLTFDIPYIRRNRSYNDMVFNSSEMTKIRDFNVVKEEEKVSSYLNYNNLYREVTTNYEIIISVENLYKNQKEILSWLSK